jgi:hypothetical protein
LSGRQKAVKLQAVSVAMGFGPFFVCAVVKGHCGVVWHR